ncbi:MAG: hypothetical protein V4565_03380 [Bacteroidota bacterium]
MEISIKKPCHENWDMMAQNEQGAFCGKCVKTVIDFSTKSLVEIKHFFESKPNEKVCGRFDKQQLTSLSFDAFFSEFKGFNFTKRFAVIVYFTFGLWLFGASSATAQTNEHLKGDVEINRSAIMGGARVMSTQKDTTTTCIKPDIGKKVVKGKVAVKHQPEPELKMGEVIAEPPGKKTGYKNSNKKK